jgi:hypothetical protein
VFLAAWLALAGTALAGAGGVKDGIGYFSPDAVKQARREIDDLRHDTGKDLFVETVARLPEEKARQFRELRNEPARARFLNEVAEEHARDAGVDGVYVLLCKEPAGHAVIAWPKENETLFPREDRLALYRIFGKLKPGDRNQDAALLQAVETASRALKANVRAQAAPPSEDSFRWTTVLWVIGGLLLLWVVVGALRARVAAPRAAAPAQGSPVLNGMIGSAAGVWLYQAFFAAPQEPAAPDAAPSPAADVVTDEAPPEPDAVRQEDEPTPSHDPF